MLVPRNSPRSSLFSISLAGLVTAFICWFLVIYKPILSIATKSEDEGILSFRWQVPPPQTKEEYSKKRFAEANPNVPQNIPEETNLLSTKDQQAAQLTKINKLSKPSKIPQADGTSNNMKVIEAKETDKQSFLPEKNPREFSKKANLSAKDKSATEKIISQNGSGESFAPTEEFTDSKMINLTSSYKKEVISPLTENNKSFGSNFKPRPKLSAEALNGPILKNSVSTARIGNIAIDCRLNPYGIYMQEMLKSIEIQWGELIKASYRYMQRDNFSKKITYTFDLLNSGKIENLRELNNTDQPSLAAEICRQAIASRAPFGKWDKDMVKEFGQSDQISITFNYL